MMDLYDVQLTDFGSFAAATLPLHRQGLIFLGGTNLDTESSQSNGSGKSTLLKALGWGLWGQSIDGEAGDRVIRRGATRATVRVRMFEQPEQYWTVERARTKGAPKLQLIQPDGKPFSGSRDALQHKINEMVGLDFLAFKNTVMYGQNDSARFADPRTKDVDRKEMLHKILRTDILKQCHERVREKRTELKRSLDEIERAAEGYQWRIDEHDLNELESQREEWENDRERQVDSLKVKVQGLKQKAQELLAGQPEDTEETDTDALEAKAEELRAKITESDGAEEQIDKLDLDLDELERRRDKAHRMESQHRATVAAKTEALEALDGEVCPVCSTPLTSEHVQEHRRELSEALQEASVKAAKCTEQIENHHNAMASIQKMRKRYRSAAAEASECLRRLNAINQRISAARLRRERLEQEQQRRVGEAKHAVAMAKEHVEQIKRIMACENPFDGALATAKAKIEEYQAELMKLRSQSVLVSQDLAHHEFWVRGFSGQGLSSFILDEVMPYITDRANHYLETLADGDITMRFATQRELKSAKGEYRDEIDIQWDVEGLEDNYPPSGGQLKKMEVATDLALMDLVATREGGHVDLLMLDEVLDGLDAEGCQRVLTLLQSLRAERGTIFVISHEAEVGEVFEHTAWVTKEGGVSRLEVRM